MKRYNHIPSTGRYVIAFACLAIVVLNSCSHLKKSKHLDLSPFAEYTMTLAMEIEYGLTEAGRTVHLRKYWSDPVIAEHRKEWNKVRVLLKSVVAYSIEVTTLGNSRLSGPERCNTLADYLEPLVRPVVIHQAGRIRISPTQLDSILTDIRGRKNLLDGLAGAQPIIDEIARVADDIFDEVKESLDETAKTLMQRIDEENARVTYYEELVRRRQYEIFDEGGLLLAYRNGDTSVLPELLELDPQLREYVASPDTLTLKEIGAIEDRLLHKIEKAREFAKQIKPDVENYAAQQQAFADLYVDASHQLRRAKVTIIVWSRVHRDLARGITDPAKINLFQLTKQAIDTAL